MTSLAPSDPASKAPLMRPPATTTPRWQALPKAFENDSQNKAIPARPG